jgi:regulator of sirC expression with transglutaminase-like and TPR domain
LIKLNSHWYTPFVFRGVAYANLKNKSKAIEDLTIAVKHTPSDPDYQEARDLLQKAKDLPN